MIRRAVAALAGLGEAVISAAPGLPAELSQATVIHQTENRPWPVPSGPWLMAQTWRDLLFAHWSLPAEALARVLPAGLPLDTFDDRAWIGITLFQLSGLRPRGALPPPLASRFAELNVRTYTTLDGRPGIYFLSLDAASALAVLAARRAYRLPYFTARMRIRREAGAIEYRSERSGADTPDAVFDATYRPVGSVSHAAAGSLEYFLTERYCLYTVDEQGTPLRADIQHPPWPLQRAEAAIRRNSMTRPWAIELPGEPPLLHFSALQKVLIWPLQPAA